MGKRLALGRRKRGQIVFDLNPAVKGTFPVFVTLHYQDPSGISYSSVALAVASTAGAAPSHVRLAVAATPLDPKEPFTSVRLILKGN